MSKFPWKSYGCEYVSLKGYGQWHDFRVVIEMDSISDPEGEIGIQFSKMSFGYRSSIGKF